MSFLHPRSPTDRTRMADGGRCTAVATPPRWTLKSPPLPLCPPRHLPCLPSSSSPRRLTVQYLGDSSCRKAEQREQRGVHQWVEERARGQTYRLGWRFFRQPISNSSLTRWWSGRREPISATRLPSLWLHDPSSTTCSPSLSRAQWTSKHRPSTTIRGQEVQRVAPYPTGASRDPTFSLRISNPGPSPPARSPSRLVKIS